MPPKEIHEDFMETLGEESPSYITVINVQQSLRGGERDLRIMDGLVSPKMPPLMKMAFTPWLSVIRGETYEA